MRLPGRLLQRVRRRQPERPVRAACVRAIIPASAHAAAAKCPNCASQADCTAPNSCQQCLPGYVTAQCNPKCTAAHSLDLSLTRRSHVQQLHVAGALHGRLAVLAVRHRLIRAQLHQLLCGPPPRCLRPPRTDHCENCESLAYCLGDNNCTLCQKGFAAPTCFDPHGFNRPAQHARPAA